MLKISKKDIRESWTLTYTGKEIYLLDPRPEYVDIRDMAHHLSLTCRYNGYCKSHYNNAHHSLLVEYCSPVKCKLESLMHDTQETYVHDIVRPFKHWLNKQGYEELEEAWRLAVCKKYDLEPYKYTKEIKKADNYVVYSELREIMGFLYTKKIRKLIQVPETKLIIPKPLSMRKSENLFLKRFKELTNGRKF